jgi:hypothetical protein
MSYKVYTNINLDEEAQDIFNRVKNHLLTQKTQSNGGNFTNSCAYRGKNNTTCAVGCLIPDELYVATIENATVLNSIRKNDLKYDNAKKLHEILTKLGLIKHYKLLQDLQNIHDSYSVNNWEYALKCCANRHNLICKD